MRFRKGGGLVHIHSAGLASLRTRSSSAHELARFRRLVWGYWRESGRHGLPWRKTTDPYKILVSEVMLQQTQVARVEEKYKEFLKRFPNARCLAKASLAEVLKIWSGLGYNRRAKYLHDAAKTVVEKHKGTLPRSYEELVALSGVGDYTARAVRVFAFNEPEVFIETNIRTALIHHFGGSVRMLSDRALCVHAEKAAKGQDPREWHSALMDYGAFLKRSGVRNNARSRHYVKQSKFEGSLRQARGRVLHHLTNGPSRVRASAFRTKRSRIALASLVQDGLVRIRGGYAVV